MKVITIGRSSQNEIVINDEKVSRHHLQIIQDDYGNFRLADFGSTNGTSVNGRRVTGELSLSPGDVIVIGNTTLPWRNYFPSDQSTATGSGYTPPTNNVDDRRPSDNWYTKPWHQYADFRGRARRKEYWIFSLVNSLIIGLTLGLGFGLMFAGGMGASETIAVVGLILTILGGLFSLAAFIPSLAVAIRRLHDSGKSGWWYLICLVPCVGGLILFIFMLLDSEPSENQWGRNPKQY
ncbi:MAG: DUF805 domain-containing protein [Candidatus Symbiothrix sp.]|jgi:uncharacterized membrane protein YhaH (DUF805 family)|nr:DUF805 domain-containing protein [Candidatus Symbiothrix sp.]